MTRLVNMVFNRSYYRVTFITITLLFTISFFTPFSKVLNFFLLGWGSLLILKDLLTKKIIFRSKRFIPLFVFMVLYFITIIINRNLNLFENIKIFSVTMLQFFILFAFDSDEDFDYVSKGMKMFNNVIIYVTFIATIISLLVYLLGINFIINDHVVGVELGAMLNGIYTGANTAGPLVAISIAVTLINSQLSEKHTLNKFGYLNIVVQLIFLYMTNSRAALYCFIAFCIIVSLFYFNTTKSKFIALCGTGAIYYMSNVVNKLLSLIYSGVNIVINYFKYIYGKIRYSNNENGVLDFAKPKLEEVLPSGAQVIEKQTSGFLNGRAQLWQCASKIIKDNPWFGVGSRNVADVALRYEDISNLPGIQGGGMHNIIIQVLVSNGILGFIALLIFIFSIIFLYIKYFLNTKVKTYKSKIVMLISGLIVMLFVNNMVEANILYTCSYISTVFWTYLGYGIFVIEKDHEKI